jgi:predicted nucleic acid-binding protein
MPNYLLDTDVLSQLTRERPHPQVIRRIFTIPFSRQFSSTISIGEMFYGAYRSARPDYHLKRIRDIILPHFHILAFDLAASEHYGQVRANAERTGHPLAISDMLIAAIALAHNLVVVTGNRQHFLPIPGLEMEDWFS